MTVPARREAARLLRSLDPPPWSVTHACVVADVAAWLAARAEERGAAVDPRTVAVAGLLHDIDKIRAARAPAGLRHGDGSAALLEARGWGELAPLVRDHPVTRLSEPGWPRWLESAPLGARIVAYADKRAGQRLQPMAARFASWRRRYPAGPKDADGSRTGGWDGELARVVDERAHALERSVCDAAGTMPEDVRRLRWSRRALAEAANR
jgi:hypothetical protein